MSNLKGLNLTTKLNKEQDENNINSNEHSEVFENKNKSKKKNKNVNNNRNEYNKSLNSFDFRKTSAYNLSSKKSETTKNTGNKKGKIETNFKKINSKKIKNN
jgi:hypothetical protein